MTREVFVISVTGEIDEVLRQQFDDVDLTVEHGVSRLRSGHRHTLGIIFHDAR